MQFSLRSLAIITLIIGMYCGLTFGMPPEIGCLGFAILTLFLPPFIIGGIIYGRGTVRAFWIGCAACGFLPWILTLYFSYMVCIGFITGDMSDFGEEGWLYTLSFAMSHAVIFASGLVVVLSKWLHAPRKKALAETPRATTDPTPDYAVIEGRISGPQSLSK